MHLLCLQQRFFSQLEKGHVLNGTTPENEDLLEVSKSEITKITAVNKIIAFTIAFTMRRDLLNNVLHLWAGIFLLNIFWKKCWL